MEAHEREYLVSQIVYGAKIIELRNKTLIVQPPTIEEQYLANRFFKKVYDEALLSGVYTRNEMLEIMEEQGVWSEEDEKQIDSTPQKGGGTVASQRAIKAIRAGRGAKDAKDKPYTPADIKTTGGTVNAKQSVGPRLRAAGFKIKSYDGEPTVGSRLQKQILRVVRQFLKTNMKRIGKDDIKVISEEIINELYNRGVFK